MRSHLALAAAAALMLASIPTYANLITVLVVGGSDSRGGGYTPPALATPYMAAFGDSRARGRLAYDHRLLAVEVVGGRVGDDLERLARLDSLSHQQRPNLVRHLQLRRRQPGHGPALPGG